MLKSAAAISFLGLALGASTPALAGELDLNFGLQATHTEWSDDVGGGPTLQATWWFKRWIGISFVGKEQYAKVDDRYMTYFSLNAAVRQDIGPLFLVGTLGAVHQHEETMEMIDEQ